jgi:hypothetical protein
LHLSFDASFILGCCSQSHEILLNKCMKYWDLGWNASGSRTFIATVHIAAAVIGWKRSGKERTRQTQFSTQFAAKLSFMPPWSPVYFFSLFFWHLVPYVTKEGVLVPCLPDFTDAFTAPLFYLLVEQWFRIIDVWILSKVGWEISRWTYRNPLAIIWLNYLLLESGWLDNMDTWGKKWKQEACCITPLPFKWHP